jgi:hypothetical protein
MIAQGKDYGQVTIFSSAALASALVVACRAR